MITGPNITTNGLIFAIDVANINCFRGESTTNILPGGIANMYPTTSNTHVTYLTENYNGGAYYSIGTITSVSGNVVTTAAAHPFVTYMCARPQSTGGGLTGGSNYFIKKISSTQFSVHAYDGTEYGGFATHASVVNDTKIAISAGVDTMWWTPPHVANAWTVKEIIPNGYKGLHDCVRLNYFRNGGGTDAYGGMAYGVTPSFVAGHTYTISFKIKAVSESAIGKIIDFKRWTNGNADDSFFTIIGNDWQTFSHTCTSTQTDITYLYWHTGDQGGSPYSYDISEIQVEEKNHSTFFSTGTRGSDTSTDGGLIDLSNKGKDHTIEGTPIFSDNPAKLYLNGSTDGFAYGASLTTSTTCTVIIFYKTTDTVELWVRGNYDNSYYLSAANGSGDYYHGNCGSPTNYIDLIQRTAPAPYRDGNYHMWEAKNVNFSSWTSFEWFLYPFTWQMNGSVSMILVYDRNLSSAESAQIYNAYKRRFGLT